MRSASGYLRSLSAATYFGSAMLVMIWAGAAYKSYDDHQSARLEAERVQQNFALIFEENVLRSIGEIDKSLLYLRRMIESRVEAQSLHEIVSTTDILSEIIVQVAVIDADGIMRATNVGPQPAKPIDLSDREHYRAHLNRTDDDIFISKPMIGRASKKWSVQLTRRFHMPDGSFGGVVVGSLNPEHFTQFYNKLNLGATAGIALVGTDGIVRSSGGNGPGGHALGQDLKASPIGALLDAEGIRTIEDATDPTDRRLVTVKKFRGYPLAVSVSIAYSEIYAEAREGMLRLVVAAVLLSGLVLLAMRQMSKAEEQRQQAENHVRRLASEDALTGLANRRVFQERVIARAAATGAEGWAIAYVDVDRFKTINDTLGHVLGDRLLQEVAGRLGQTVGGLGEIARLGGDEFAILFPHVSDPDRLHALAETLVAEASKPFSIDGQVINCTISVGVARWPVDALTADELIVCADLALYASKESGRNRASYFDSSMNDKVSRRREIEIELRAALNADKLQAHFQPIFSIEGKIVGFEALARWHHDDKGWIPPGIFIGVAEECGLMPAVGEQILKQACRAAASWPAHIKLAVNLSAAQFGTGDVPGIVRAAVDEAGLDPRRLEIEITESLLLENSAPIRDALARLKSFGVGIAMDDFGTGYSSLSYLQKFPLNKIKIDRSFVRSIATDACARSIVEAIINIAHSLGMVATAEGVETQDQFDALAALGCDQIQGFLLGRPLTPERAGESASMAEAPLALAAE